MDSALYSWLVNWRNIRINHRNVDDNCNNTQNSKTVEKIKSIQYLGCGIARQKIQQNIMTKHYNKEK